MQCILSLLRIDSNQGIDIIQRIEQKVGIKLTFQILQFRFGALLFDLLFFTFDSIPTACHFDGHTQSSDQ